MGWARSSQATRNFQRLVAGQGGVTVTPSILGTERPRRRGRAPPRTPEAGSAGLTANRPKPRAARMEGPSAKQNVQARAARAEPPPERSPDRSAGPATPLPTTPPRQPSAHGRAPFTLPETPKASSAITARPAHLPRPLRPHLLRVQPQPLAPGPASPGCPTSPRVPSPRPRSVRRRSAAKRLLPVETNQGTGRCARVKVGRFHGSNVNLLRRR